MRSVGSLLRIVELPFFCSGDKGLPLRIGEDQNWPDTVVLGIPDAYATGHETAYLNAATI
jgi:hypothetical protein